MPGYFRKLYKRALPEALALLLAVLPMAGLTAYAAGGAEEPGAGTGAHKYVISNKNADPDYRHDGNCRQDIGGVSVAPGDAAWPDRIYDTELDGEFRGHSDSLCYKTFIDDPTLERPESDAGTGDQSGDAEEPVDEEPGFEHGEDCVQMDHLVCGDTDPGHVHGDDCYESGWVDEMGWEHDDTCIKAPYKPEIMTPEFLAVSGGYVSCVWAQSSGIECTGDVSRLLTWRVDKTDLRYAEIGIVVNMGSNGGTVGVGQVEAVLPYKIGTGRSGAFDASYASHSGAAGISVSVDRTAGTVTVRNSAELSSTDHLSMTVFYKLDCWNTPSNKQFNVGFTTSVDGNATAGSLGGIVVTDLGMSVSNSHHSIPSFANVDDGDHYADRYNPAYLEYFGISEGAFDTGRYIYDVMNVTVYPTKQQPYDISGTLIPGRYPKRTDNGAYRPYGWDGEVVAGVLMPDTYDVDTMIPVSVRSAGSKSYDQLPGSGSNSSGSNSWILPEARAHTWNQYEFSVDHGKLPVISKFSDGQTGSYPYYTLSFLVRWPKNSGSTSYNNSNEPDKAGFTTLNCYMQVRHAGLDGASGSGSADRRLYLGSADRVDYGGNIYGASYLAEYSMADSKNGMSQLQAGKRASIGLLAEWVCLNENRPGQVVDRASYKVKDTYALEAIVDTALLSQASDLSAMRLRKGDYRIASYGLAIIDNYGTNTENPDGTWNVGWSDYGIPDALRNEPVYVYGSENEYGNSESDWVLVGQSTLGEVWVKDSYLSIRAVDDTSLAGHDFVRLKVVYPNSRLTTAIRLRYNIELIPGGSTVSQSLSNASANGSDSLQLTSWLNYTAYRTSDYARYHTDPSVRIDLDTRRDAITSKDTGGVVRNWDDLHPYPGYSSSNSATGYPYRNFFQTRLGSSTDAVGMVVSQMLFAGGLCGSDDNSQDAYSMYDAATNVEKVVYRIHGGATDSYDKNTSVVERRTADLADGVVSPYVAESQRYYVLLPEGMTLDKGSVHPYKNADCGTDGHYHRNFVSNASLGDIPMYVEKYGKTYYTDGGWFGSYYFSDVSYRQVDTGGRELVIFDRKISFPGEMNSYYMFGTLSSEPRRYVYGKGLEFAIVPKAGAGNLASGNYETLFLHQFLDGSGNPIPVDGYAGDIYATGAEAFGTAGIHIDESAGIAPDGGVTFTAISAAFRNRTGSGSSSAEVKVKNEGPIQDKDYSYETVTELESGRYRYALSYKLDDGSSRDVVLWDNVEAYDRNGAFSEWRGVLTGVDLNGTGARVFVNESENIDVDSYLTQDGNNDPASYRWLQSGSHGWKEVKNPGTYSGWSNVKAVAFWFDGVTFSAAGNDSATVYLDMAAPKEIQGVSGGTYTAYNEILLSDYHVETNAAMTVLVKPVKISLNVVPAVSYQDLPATGGEGFSAILAISMLGAIAGAAVLMLSRKRES